jgi:hypothetical protein
LLGPFKLLFSMKQGKELSTVQAIVKGVLKICKKHWEKY